MAQPNYHVEKTLVLSTGHIPETTAEFLKASEEGLIHSLPYGWLIYVDFVRNNVSEDVHPELNKIADEAHAIGCLWVNLDQDGPMMEHLPLFDW